MARQIEFPRLNRWSRAVLAVVWAGLVLAASPALGKTWYLSPVSVQGMIDYEDLDDGGDPGQDAGRNGLNIKGNFNVKLMKSQSFRDEDIPLYPLALALAWGPYMKFDYGTGSEWIYSKDNWQAPNPPCIYSRSVAKGFLVNYYTPDDSKDVVIVWISKVKLLDFIYYRIGFDFRQKWIMDGSFDHQECAPGRYQREIASFLTSDYYDIGTVEDIKTLFGGLISFATTTPFWNPPAYHCEMNISMELLDAPWNPPGGAGILGLLLD
jgi:hypothetical protein